MKIFSCCHLSAILCLPLLLSCHTTKAQLTGGAETSPPVIVGEGFTVEEAPEWTALFKRSSGWFGGDGIFAIPLDGRETGLSSSQAKNMVIFSDSMIGEIEGDSLMPGFSMVNNSVAYLHGHEPKAINIRFDWAKDSKGRPTSIFVPQTPSSEKGDYYWLGDGFLNPALDSTIYVFAYRMRNMDDAEEWSFKEMGTDLIALSAKDKFPFKKQKQIETPFRFEDVGFGAGIFVNTQQAGVINPDGYVYIYGVRGMEKNLMVSRVLPKDFEDFQAWRFWDGVNWNASMEKVAMVTPHVSNELSLSVLPDGRYALIFTVNGLGPVVGMKIGDTPYGPFGPVIELYRSGEMQQKNYLTYNAKAHPSLSGPGELLISYNVNAFSFFDEIKANPYLYRPRFIKLKFADHSK